MSRRVQPLNGGKVLVTGGAGYVGSALVRQLLDRGRQVRVLDSLLHGSVPSLLGVWCGDLEFQRGDVRDAAARSSALEGVEAVVHLAAIVGDPACARAPEEAERVNRDASIDLLGEARDAGVRQFVFASTCSNYGRAGNEVLATEQWPLQPVSLYAETKVAAEVEILAASDERFATTCLRLATVYGPSARMRFDLTVNEFTRDVFSGLDLVVYGEQFWRPYVHVRDAARAIMATLEADHATVAGEVFNVGDTDENYRKIDLVGLLQERADFDVSYVHRDEDPRDYRVDFGKIHSSMGFEVSARVPDGIDEVASLVQSGLLEDPFAACYRN
jgi:nucleoside-diphosphate-sugar epimerase